MVTVIKEISRFKLTQLNRLLAFLILLIILSGEFLESIYMLLFSKNLPVYIVVSVQAASYLLAGIIGYILMTNVITHNTTTSSSNSLITFLMNLFLGMSFIGVFKYMLSIPLLFNQALGVVFLGISVLVGVIGLGIFSVTTWLIAKNSAKPSNYLYYFLHSIKLYFSRISFIILHTIIVLVTLVISYAMDQFLWPILIQMNLMEVTILFYKVMGFGTLLASVLLFIIKALVVVYKESPTFEPEKKSPIGYILIGLFVVGTIYTMVPRTVNATENAYRTMIHKAERYRRDGQLYLCGNEYKKAYELIRTYKESVANSESMSERKIKKTIEQIEGYEQVCLKNMTTVAYDYYNHQLYPEAMKELQLIKEMLPNDVVTNYLIAMTDLELKADNKAYTMAIEAAQSILDQYPAEEWAQELYVGVALRAGNQEVMDETLQTAYKRNPKDLDIAEQYAYALLKKNYTSSYYEVTEEAEAVVDHVLSIDQDRWFANYCKALIMLYKGDYERSLAHMNRFIKQMIEDESLFSIYDELYNTYVVKYTRRMVMDPIATSVLEESELVDPFIYNYIQGAYGTLNREVSIEETIEFLNTALTYNTNFSKVYYMLGNSYMEQGHVNEDKDAYVKAEGYYKTAIGIFKDDPYAWFALGHAYKKQGRYEEAEGAFLKTLTLMPTEDHQSDHFGVSIHSTYQINELRRLIEEKGGQ